jgi:opacity protein-like surface antigen
MKKLLIVLFLAPASCFAIENQLEFNLGRGTPLSSIQAGGSSDRDGSRGTEWSADFLHQVGRQVYVGLGGGHFKSNDNVSETFVSNAESTIVSRMTSVFVLGRADLAPPSNLVPYFIAGVGWVRNSLTVTTVPGGILLEDSKNTLGFATGLGLDYALSSKLFIGIEARYQTSLKRTFDLTPAGQTVTGQGNVQTPLNIFMLGVKAGIKY